MPDVAVRLKLKNIAYPNSSIDRQWYKGVKSISWLEFQGGTLLSIQSDAFSSDCFKYLQLIRFYDIKNFHISHFDSNSIREITYERMEIESILIDFLIPHAKRLTEISITFFPSSQINFEFLKCSRFLELIYVYIVGERHTVSRSLEEHAFYRLPRIQLISLRYCGIEFIHSNTFDFIGQTLLLLDLSFNRIKIINSKWFLLFLDSYYIYRHKHLLLAYNPIIIDCNLIDLDLLTRYINGDVIQHSLFQFPNHSCNVQSITKEKLYIDNFNRPGFEYPRVDFGLVGDILLVKTSFSLKIRILIQYSHSMEIRKKSMCPSPEWIRESTLCFYLDDKPKVIQIHRFFKKSNIILVYAILPMPFKRIWPLHIQSIRNPFDINHLDYSMTIVWTIIWIDICLIISALMVIFCKLYAVYEPLDNQIWYVIRLC